MARTKLLPENYWCKWKIGENIFAEITMRSQLSKVKEISEVSKTQSWVQVGNDHGLDQPFFTTLFQQSNKNN